MRVRLVLPAGPVSAYDFERCVRSLYWRFGDVPVECEAPEELRPMHHAALGVVLAPHGHRPFEADEVVVFIELQDGGPAALQAQEGLGRKTYYFDLSKPFHRARLLPATGIFGPEDGEHLNADVFNRLSHPGETNAYYTMLDTFPIPHTWASRCYGLGRIEPFGFRHHPDKQAMRARPPTRKLICIFGNSSSWGFDCLPDEVSTHLIEQHLNQWAEDAGAETRFTVLNFSVHGATVMDNLVSYLLFAEMLAPEVVVCHAGANDLLFGAANDADFLGAYALSYTPHFEIVAAKRSNAGKPLSHQLEADAHPSSQVVAAAFLARGEQFRRIAEARGSQFLFSLQPFIGSRAAPGPAEQLLLAEPDPKRDLLASQVERLRDDADFRRLAEGGVDWHAVFAARDASENLFVDAYHTTPAGERLLAEVYFRLLRSHFADVVESQVEQAGAVGRGI